MSRNGEFKFLVVAIAFVSLAAFGQAQRKVGASSATHGPAGTPVLIKCDMDCLLTIDGAQAQSLSASDTKLVSLSSGQHLIEASDKDNTTKWSKVLSASGPDQIVLIIELQALAEQAAARKRSEEAQVKERAAREAEEAAYRDHPTWTDPATGLMWARQDNGDDVNWSQASNYCRNLNLGSHSDWRLPAYDELAAIYDQTKDVNGFHIKGGIGLTNHRPGAALAGAVWSNSTRRGPEGEERADGFHFRFGPMKKGFGYPVDTRGVRVLCVRDSRQ